MSGPWVTVGAWVGHATAGGGLLLLLAWFLMRRTRQPMRSVAVMDPSVPAVLNERSAQKERRAIVNRAPSVKRKLPL